MGIIAREGYDLKSFFLENIRVEWLIDMYYPKYVYHMLNMGIWENSTVGSRRLNLDSTLIDVEHQCFYLFSWRSHACGASKLAVCQLISQDISLFSCLIDLLLIVKFINVFVLFWRQGKMTKFVFSTFRASFLQVLAVHSKHIQD